MCLKIANTIKTFSYKSKDESKGKIKGNLTANGRATLQSAAQMIGDVTARLISLNEGARVRGKVTMASNSPDIDFDIDIKI
ncbi:MAG: polymer-forming cytoskeletal protein [Hydrogenoanaerobacterium sp.]